MEVDYFKKMLANINGPEGNDGDAGEEGSAKETEEKEDEGGCEPCGGTDEEKVMNQLFSMMKGLKGGKGGKGGAGKGRFEGNCSHCGVYGHRLRECWKKDREMEDYRAQKGKGNGKGKGQTYGGKGQYGGYQPKGGWKGGWNSKGQGKAMNVWAPTPAYGDDSWGGKTNAWAFSLSKQEGDWQLAKKTMKPRNGERIEPPPGLSSGFEVLSCSQAKLETESLSEYPGLDGSSRDAKPKMPRMPNYSKNWVRKQQGNEGHKPKKNEGQKPNINEAQKAKILNMFMKAPEPEAKDLNPFIGAKPDAAGWTRVKGVMDSGASESVAPPNMCPQYKVFPSPGSIAGQNYVSASDDVIPNLGEQYLNIVTKTGRECVAKYQVADVTRPLNAISEICDAGGEEGQLVIFGKHGGYVWNLETGSWTEFEREDGVYTFEFWVRPPNETPEGFTRLG